MNATQLEATLNDSLRGTRLIVVANREPYIHIRRRRSARGMWNWLRGRRETEAIECGIGVLVGLRPTSATHKLDGITDVDRFLRWLATEGNVSRTI